VLGGGTNNCERGEGSKERVLGPRPPERRAQIPKEELDEAGERFPKEAREEDLGDGAKVPGRTGAERPRRPPAEAEGAASTSGACFPSSVILS
jgi:hypothetical protein